MRSEPTDRLQGAGNERQVLPVERFEPAHDLGRDLLGRLGQAELVVHVPRPLVRAHAHHRPLRTLVPAPAALLHELSSRLAPDLFGVE